MLFSNDTLHMCMKPRFTESGKHVYFLCAGIAHIFQYINQVHSCSVRVISILFQCGYRPCPDLFSAGIVHYVSVRALDHFFNASAVTGNICINAGIAYIVLVRVSALCVQRIGDGLFCLVDVRYHSNETYMKNQS